MRFISAKMLSAILLCTLLSGCISSQQVPPIDPDNPNIQSGGVPVVVRPVKPHVYRANRNSVEVDLEPNWNTNGSLTFKYSVTDNAGNIINAQSVFVTPPTGILTTRSTVIGNTVSFELQVSSTAPVPANGYLTVNINVTGMKTTKAGMFKIKP